MEQKLPYEQQLSEQWTDLPLPNEDTCWADMSKRLEEEEDDRPIIFWWRRGCAQWGLLLVALISVGWWAYERYSKTEIARTTGNSPKPVIVDNNPSPATYEKRVDRSTKKITKEHDDSKHLTNSAAGSKNQDTIDSISSLESRIQKPPHQAVLVKNWELSERKVNQPKEKNKIRTQESKKTKKSLAAKSEIMSDQERDKKAKATTNSNSKVSNKPDESDLKAQAQDTTKNTPVDSTIKQLKDTVHKPSPATKKDTLDPQKTLPKVDSAKKSSYFFSGGLSLHQQIPTAGQSFTPYNTLGRKGSLADYIPAPYIRFTKKDKWFIQAEFRYGAPVYTPSFVYDQDVVVDTLNDRTITNSLRLKKTFYHQLPLSFHYTIKPGFTIGTGIVWNKFKGAIAEQELISRNRTTGVETLLGKGIIKDSSAQSFAKSFFQAHVEAQYQWKRLQLGARYNFGVEPFVKFNLPGLGEQSRKSNSLQVFFRYQIWRSKKPEQP